jgi:hypothetical protein
MSVQVSNLGNGMRRDWNRPMRTSQLQGLMASDANLSRMQMNGQLGAKSSARAQAAYLKMCDDNSDLKRNEMGDVGSCRYLTSRDTHFIGGSITTAQDLDYDNEDEEQYDKEALENGEPVQTENNSYEMRWRKSLRANATYESRNKGFVWNPKHDNQLVEETMERMTNPHYYNIVTNQAQVTIEPQAGARLGYGVLLAASLQAQHPMLDPGDDPRTNYPARKYMWRGVGLEAPPTVQVTPVAPWVRYDKNSDVIVL